MQGTTDNRCDASGMRVLMVDRRRAFSEALAERLRQESDVVIVGLAGTPQVAEGALDDLHPTVVTVAIYPGSGGEGLVLVTRARRTHPAIRWVVIAADGEPFDLADAVVAGASGYVTMDSPVTALLETLRGAAAGLSITPDGLLRRVLMEVDGWSTNAELVASRRPLVSGRGLTR